MTALEVIDDLLGRKLLDWTRDELVAARVCALNGTLPSDEESYWRTVHARLQKTETEHATPEDLARAQICKVFPLWAAQGPFQSGGASAAAMRNAMATVLTPREVDQMADDVLMHAVSYDSDPTGWEQTWRTWAKTETSESNRLRFFGSWIWTALCLGCLTVAACPPKTWVRADDKPGNLELDNTACIGRTDAIEMSVRHNPLEMFMSTDDTLAARVMRGCMAERGWVQR